MPLYRVRDVELTVDHQGELLVRRVGCPTWAPLELATPSEQMAASVVCDLDFDEDRGIA